MSPGHISSILFACPPADALDTEPPFPYQARATRYTYDMADKIPPGRASILVQSLDGAGPEMVERAMYFNNRGAGTCTVGGSDTTN